MDDYRTLIVTSRHSLLKKKSGQNPRFHKLSSISCCRRIDQRKIAAQMNAMKNASRRRNAEDTAIPCGEEIKPAARKSVMAMQTAGIA